MFCLTNLLLRTIKGEGRVVVTGGIEVREGEGDIEKEKIDCAFKI